MVTRRHADGAGQSRRKYSWRDRRTVGIEPLSSPDRGTQSVSPIELLFSPVVAFRTNSVVPIHTCTAVATVLYTMY